MLKTLRRKRLCEHGARGLGCERLIPHVRGFCKLQKEPVKPLCL
jgi:hypothetical protein